MKKCECFDVKTINDLALFNDVQTSFNKMGFTPEEQNTIWRIVSGILFLGNVNFDDKNFGDTDPCVISDKNTLSRVYFTF